MSDFERMAIKRLLDKARSVGVKPPAIETFICGSTNGGARLYAAHAFRKDSPERSVAWEEEALLALPASGDPFWCHDGMRRPSTWRHPAGVLIDGDPADYRPPQRSGIPYRADGSPGLLCAGWMARAVRIAPTAGGDR